MSDKKPSRKSSEVREERILAIVSLLRRGYSKHAIFDVLRRKHGKISVHTLESYTTDAKRRLAEEYGLPREQFTQDAYHFFSWMRTNPEASAQVQLMAQEQICKLFGLYPPPPKPVADEGDGTPKLSPAQLRDKINKLLTEPNDVDSAPGNPAAMLSDTSPAGSDAANSSVSS